MTKVTIDAATKAKLLDLQKYLEVFDEEGKLLGFVHPAPPPGVTMEEMYKSPFTEEELDERAKHLEGKPLSEILKRLKGE